MVCIMVAAGAGYLVWYMQVEHVADARTALRVETAEKDAARLRSAAAKSAEAELLGKEQFIAAHFVETANIVSFLETLEAAGKGYGVTVQVASLGEGATSEGKLTLSLSMSGSFDGVMKTLGSIENGPYATMVNDLTFDTTDQGKTWNAVGVFIVGTASKK